MSTEIRIGIVAGLLVVVVASVYFFYGNGAKEEEFLLSAGPRVDAPPKIPASARRDSRTSGDSRSSGKSSPPTFNIADKQARAPRRDSRSANIPQRSRERTATPWSPTRDRPSSATLRTIPAPQLVEATQDNLDKARQSPVVNRGTGLASLGERIRAGSERPLGTTRRPPATNHKSPAPALWPKRHKIAAGDTLSAIAVRYYGSSSLFPDILKANPAIANPGALKVGCIITIPDPGNTTPSTSLSPAPSFRTYMVQEGDTFYSITREQCGSGTRWQDVYQLNKDLVKNNPKKLRPGMIIKLP